MHKLKRKSTATKSAKSSVLTRNGASKKTKKSKLVGGKKLYTVRDAKGRFVDIQAYERAHVIAEKATASEIRKALGITRETTERVRQIIRDLEEKNWQVD